jgi:beta-fructofuranosidase
MVVGAGLADGSGAVVQYVSDDLEEWTRSGVLCARSSTETEGAWTGSVWECPQFFPLGDTWVLLVSVWHDDVLHRVVAATGEYDGRRFVPRRWQALTQGESAYATSAFVDREERRCLISWLREGPGFEPDSAERAGAESLPYVLSLGVDGGLRLELHPDVMALLAARDETGVTSWIGADISLVVDGDIVELCTGDVLTVVRRRGVRALSSGS